MKSMGKARIISNVMIPFYFKVQLISGDLFGYFQNRTFYETVNRHRVLAADQGFSRGNANVVVCVGGGEGGDRQQNFSRSMCTCH